MVINDVMLKMDNYWKQNFDALNDLNETIIAIKNVFLQNDDPEVIYMFIYAYMLRRISYLEAMELPISKEERTLWNNLLARFKKED